MQMLDLTSISGTWRPTSHSARSEIRRKPAELRPYDRLLAQSVPLGAEYAADPERTGMVLESLAYESMKRVTPAYYDKTLIGKYFRDDESVEMLDIILKTRVFDLGWYYQLGLYNDEILYMVYAEKNNWASRYEKYESKALADTERINSAFEEFLGRQ